MTFSRKEFLKIPGLGLLSLDAPRVYGAARHG